MAKTEMKIEEAIGHAGAADWEALERRAREALPHYIWTWKQEKKMMGYCTACHEESWIRLENAVPAFVTEDPYIDEMDEQEFHHPERAFGLEGPPMSTYWKGKEAFDGSGRHGHYGRCPICGTLAQYRSFSMGRKTLTDRIFLIRYAPSAIEEEALVMTGWFAQVNWGWWDDLNEREPEIDITLREICVFRHGKGGERFVAHPIWEGETVTLPDGNLKAVGVHRTGLRWERRKKCVGGFDPYQPPFGECGTRFYLDAERMNTAIAGTRWGAPYQPTLS